MSRTIVLFGPPGCGKGTQALRLKEALSVPHVSTGDMFRDHLSRETEIGKEAKAIMNAGKLVPDSITNAMVEERLGRDDVAGGVLLDGYPRNVAQAKVLTTILASQERKLAGVVAIEVPNAELVERILKRGQDSGRKDDQDRDTIQTRLRTYEEQTAPCLAHYEQSEVPVHRIQGVGSVDEVTQRILNALGL